MAALRARCGWAGGAPEPVVRRYLRGEHHPQEALAARLGVLADVDGTLVGYAAGHLTTRLGCAGEVQWLLVAPESRGGQVASALLGHLARWLVAAGARRVCVNVEPANERARRFYRRHGATDLSEYWMVWPDIGAAFGESDPAPATVA